MVRVRPLAIPDVREITPQRYGDRRGFFSAVWTASDFAAQGIAPDWAQDNHSYSAEAGVLRGLHYQEPPYAQAKLVRVIRGAIFDVAVDLRIESPDFGKWVGLKLSAESWNQIFVPWGFAHGFLTLEPETEVLYKVSAPYSPAHERAIRFDDPELGIEWPLRDLVPILSAKDENAPLFRDAPRPFRYDDRP